MIYSVTNDNSSDCKNKKPSPNQGRRLNSAVPPCLPGHTPFNRCGSQAALDRANGRSPAPVTVVHRRSVPLTGIMTPFSGGRRVQSSGAPHAPYRASTYFPVLWRMIYYSCLSISKIVSIKSLQPIRHRSDRVSLIDSVPDGLVDFEWTQRDSNSRPSQCH